jgi:HlyD family secretion protein
MSVKKKVAILIVCLVIVGFVVLALIPSPIDVIGSRVQKGYFAEYVEDEGHTRLRDTYPVSAPISGYLRRVKLEQGDKVRRGDSLFTLEPTPASALDPRTRTQARKSVSAARESLKAAKAFHENRRTDARFAEKDYQRYQQLFDRSVVPASEMDMIRNTWERSRFSEREAKAAVEVARYELENAKALLEVVEGARTPEDEGILNVLAPVDGVVLSRDRFSEGVIQAGEPILTLGNLAELEVRVDLLSMDAVRVSVGDRVIIERWGKDIDLEGRVRQVEPSGFKRVSALGVDEWRVPVLVEITSPPEMWVTLGENFRIEARFVLWEGEDVIYVSTSALFRVNESWKVFVVEDGRARLRTVKTGRRSGLRTQILSGLHPDEIVITHPGDHIEDGSRVNVELRAENITMN